MEYLYLTPASSDDIFLGLNSVADGMTFVAQSQTSEPRDHYAFTRIIVTTVEMPDIQVLVDVSFFVGRILKMVKRGWTLTGHSTCDNPCCILASNEAHAQFVEKLRALHEAYAQITIDTRFTMAKKCDYLSPECISFVENWK